MSCTKNRDIQGGDELSETIKTVLELRGLLDGCEYLQKIRGGYEESIAVLKAGTWKDRDLMRIGLRRILVKLRMV